MPAKAPWIGTSWKMHKTRAEADSFAQTLAASPVASTRKVRPFVIPPFTALARVSDILAGTAVRVGAQNMHWADSGAWTGEISPVMVKDAGAGMVEIGHSERRTHFNETDETVALKVRAALEHGLIPLVCIGDSKAEYNVGATTATLIRQVHFALSLIRKEDVSRVVFAYEPVWSIGEGGTPADPDFANRQHSAIKDEVKRFYGAKVDVVYGGSVNLDNCKELISQSRIDGLFIGRAAWNAKNYLRIVDTVIKAMA